MVRLKNPHRECPIDGFWVEIGAIKQKRQFWSYREATAWPLSIATSNPHLGLPTDPAYWNNFVSQQNALRCLTYAGGENYVIREGGPVHLETKKATLLKPLVAVGDKLRQLHAGTVLLAEWLGEGCPTVPADESACRAATCAVCPQNGLGDLTRWFTVFASEGIRQGIETAQKQGLKTPSDDKLGICEACLCPLKLKVHVPLANIKKHQTPKAQAALDLRCWILK